ncbi:DNA double-strand break repair nuclease NurA, partial [Candidatus Bathyarchaeota archaeon]|nr:DNA double-strand break repair nuclease NurA [Candidatus Bathyarchaeota archaeon]
MPEFLDLYVQDLTAKKTWINDAYSQPAPSPIAAHLRREFENYWRFKEFPKASPDEFKVLAVDGSLQYVIMPNGGIFYVVRALAMSNTNAEFRSVHTGFDYISEENYRAVIGRVMEWLEHEVILDVLNKGFEGYVLIDGSIYGRLAHVPLEVNSTYSKDFMVKYFETVIKLFNTAREGKIPIIGLSKESRSSFLKEFLMRKVIFKLTEEFNLNVLEVATLMSRALNKRGFSNILEKTPTPIREFMIEYATLKPDFLLIMNYARKPGYSTPLILNPPNGAKKAFRLIKADP